MKMQDPRSFVPVKISFCFRRDTSLIKIPLPLTGWGRGFRSAGSCGLKEVGRKDK